LALVRLQKYAPEDQHIGGYDDIRALEKENKLLELLK